MERIPIVDFSPFSIERSDSDVDKSTLNRTVDQLDNAFRNVGFVYLTNHGISSPTVSTVFNFILGMYRPNVFLYKHYTS